MSAPPPPRPPPRHRELDAIAEELVVSAGVAPAAVVAVATRRGRDWELGVGAAGRLSPGRGGPATPDTLFDLASVTKPFVAATTARLVASGHLSLTSPLATLLPELERAAAGRATLEQLLSHRAGLEAHRELFHPLLTGRAVDGARARRWIAAALRPDCSGPVPAAGWAPLYSDLGYLLLGDGLEARLHHPLDALVAREVSVPLTLAVGSARQWLCDALPFGERVAPTEHIPWRGGTLRGVVHDENAWTLVGHGLAGHAGLFGSADGVARFGAALLDALEGRSPWLSRGCLEPLVAPRPGGSLRAGFDGRSPGASAAGTRASERVFGHLGFTGTSFWCDPSLETVTVLLTNRVCPSRENLLIRAARPLVHDALLAHAHPGCQASAIG